MRARLHRNGAACARCGRGKKRKGKKKARSPRVNADSRTVGNGVSHLPAAREPTKRASRSQRRQRTTAGRWVALPTHRARSRWPTAAEEGGCGGGPTACAAGAVAATAPAAQQHTEGGGGSSSGRVTAEQGCPAKKLKHAWEQGRVERGRAAPRAGTPQPPHVGDAAGRGWRG